MAVIPLRIWMSPENRFAYLIASLSLNGKLNLIHRFLGFILNSQ